MLVDFVIFYLTFWLVGKIGWLGKYIIWSGLYFEIWQETWPMQCWFLKVLLYMYGKMRNKPDEETLVEDLVEKQHGVWSVSSCDIMTLSYWYM